MEPLRRTMRENRPRNALPNVARARRWLSAVVRQLAVRSPVCPEQYANPRPGDGQGNVHQGRPRNHEAEKLHLRQDGRSRIQKRPPTAAVGRGVQNTGRNALPAKGKGHSGARMDARWRVPRRTSRGRYVCMYWAKASRSWASVSATMRRGACSANLRPGSFTNAKMNTADRVSHMFTATDPREISLWPPWKLRRGEIEARSRCSAAYNRLRQLTLEEQRETAKGYRVACVALD